MTRYDMLCTCDPEGQRDSEELRQEVQQNLGCKSRDLTTAVVLSLAWHFGAEARVFSDQWFGVAVTAPGFSGYVPCDLPLDGLCFLWAELALLSPEKLPPLEDPVEDVSALSNRQIAASFAAEQNWEEHQKRCETCSGTTPYECGIGHVLSQKTCDIRDSIDDKWGLPPVKLAPLFWGTL